MNGEEQAVLQRLLKCRDSTRRFYVFFHTAMALVFGLVGFACVLAFVAVSSETSIARNPWPVIAMVLVVVSILAGLSWHSWREARRWKSTDMLAGLTSDLANIVSFSVAGLKWGAGVGPISLTPFRQIWVNLIDGEGRIEQFKIPGKMLPETVRLLSSRIPKRVSP